MQFLFMSAGVNATEILDPVTRPQLESTETRIPSERHRHLSTTKQTKVVYLCKLGNILARRCDCHISANPIDVAVPKCVCGCAALHCILRTVNRMLVPNHQDLGKRQNAR